MRQKIQKIKVKKILILLAAVMLLMFVASACGYTKNNSSIHMRTITDMSDREVKIPDDPQRITCVYSSAAHMMVMLDEQDKIVGVPNGVKSDELMKKKIKNLRDLPPPMQNNDINAESLMDAETDLIIVKEDQITSKGQREKLDKLDIPWIVVDYNSMEELNHAIKLMGDIFNDEKRADEFISFSNNTIKTVKNRIGKISNKDRPAVYHSVNEAIRTDETGSICQAIMETAGISDISADKDLATDGNKTYATIEEIYKWNPEGIIANESSVTEYILSNEKWKGLDAVKNKKVYTLPVGVTRWCHPGSMEAHMGVLAIASRFYPDKFKDFDIKKYVKNYYKNFFDIELDDKTVLNILAGKGMRQSNEAEKK